MQNIKVSEHAIIRFRERVLPNKRQMDYTDKQLKEIMKQCLNKGELCRMEKKRQKVHTVVRLNDNYYLVHLVIDNRWGGIVTCLGFEKNMIVQRGEK